MINARKSTAINLRERGKSIREIEKSTGVSRSTLSGWFKTIHLSAAQILALKINKELGLIKARKFAVLHHRRKKFERLDLAKKSAISSVNALNLNDKDTLKLALAMLFIGEGFKAAEETSLGNSNPLLVKSYVSLLQTIYGLKRDKLRVYLHLRADQKVPTELKYWKKTLEIEEKYFKIAPIDKRTIGKPTYNGYHGVCVIRYYDVSIKRELLEIASRFFDSIV